MSLLNILVKILLITAMASIFYKMWYHKRLMNVDNKNATSFFLYKFSPISILLPLRQRPGNAFDNKQRKRANIALYVFYVSSILCLLLSDFVN